MDNVAELEEVVRNLAAIDNRGSATPGEYEAALWLKDRFEEHGCLVTLDGSPAHGTYWWPMGIGAGLGTIAALLGVLKHRILSIFVAILSFACLIDDVCSGPRILRKYFLPKKTCWNVVARSGDQQADRTVVVIAHHDAPHTGAIFDQRAQIFFGKHFPKILEKINTAPPLYWPVIAGPALVALGSLVRNKKLVLLGGFMSSVSTGIFADVGASPTNQGANDNLSGVAGLVWLARQLNERPISGLKVILASCGSEESLQEGISAFMEKYSHELPIDKTYFINLETVGSPELLLLEGEGPILMRDYQEPFKDFVANIAEQESISITRGHRARTTTDSLITSRKGYPTATFTSINQFKALSNYHLLTDTPDNLDWGTVENAARLAHAIVRTLSIA